MKMILKRIFTLKVQLTLLFIGLLVVVITIIMVFINGKTLKIVMKNTEQSKQMNFESIENDINTLMQNVEKTLHSIMLYPQVTEFMTNSYGFDMEGVLIRKDIGGYLDKILVLNHELNSIYIQTSCGNQIGTEGSYNYNEYEQPIDKNDLIKPMSNWSLIKFNTYASKKKAENTYGLSLQSRFNNAGTNRYTNITMNVNEFSLRQIIARFSGNDKSNVYLCDGEGLILSHRDVNLINTQPDFFESFESTSSNGSFIYKDPKYGTQQIIYRTMDSAGWTIFEELPLKQYTKDIDSLKNSILIIVLISIFVAVLLSVAFIKKITTPLTVLTNAMEKMKQGDVGYQIDAQYNNEFGNLITDFNDMSLSIHQLIANNKMIERQKMNYAIAALKSQINPHFIFNTINMIKWMAITQNAVSIKQSLEKLLILLKPLFKDKGIASTIQEEIAYAQNYIELMNLRFGGNITLSVNLSDKVLMHTIPKFIIQPIIENCIEHAFREGETTNGIIDIACVQDEQLCLLIHDNGMGMTQQVVEALQERFESTEELIENGDRIGMANVNMRIKLKYGKEYGLNVESSQHLGTTIIVKLPKFL